ncbi:hypothetical protein QNH46_04230 [Paenibacillus woosongensis]|uniref:Uncharacterized protein n=1 Tax=Paenibacillus woosongensis TaxID=307580 RepID=A0AA95IB41_9BACL|nr:hypothetical protein [Paenibacillus woosongensis]WHX49892.1 hypothetical protein QNH46_04230 [Paenibacillus woosongensis]
MKKVIPYALIVLGLLVMLYPKANEYYENAQTQELLQAINSSAKSGYSDTEIDSRLLSEYKDVSRTLEEMPYLEDTGDNVNEQISHSEHKKAASSSETNSKKAIAVIKIAKIKLNLPVLEGLPRPI